MGTKTGIEWTDHTFNPWIGCTKVSAGCANCYAKTRDDRHMLGPVSHWGPGAPRHVTSAANWREPLSWAKWWRKEGRRGKVFCASQADIFESEAPVEARRRLWGLIGETCDALDWQLLTKRPEDIISVMCDDGLNLGFFELAHCWIGASTENQAAADKRIPALLDVDAAVHFISAEPLLGPVNLDSEDAGGLHALGCGGGKYCACGTVSLDLVICGGESGPNARPMHPDWARSLRDQCAAADVPFFFKQWGEWAPCENGEVTPNPQDWDTPPPTHEFHGDDRPRCAQEVVYRIGKKAAGSLLDGVEWKEFPAVRP